MQPCQSSKMGKTALVTGASSGIGKIFATELAKEGYRVTCVARSETKLSDLVRQLGEGHRYICADLTDDTQLSGVETDIQKSDYQLLINNAGYAVYDAFENVSLGHHEGVVKLNISALLRLSHVFLTGARAGDALINVSSALSRLAYPGGAVYCGTKAFVTHFTEALWYEFKDKGVYVMALLPGLTDTNFHRVAMGDHPLRRPQGLISSPEAVVREALAVLKKRAHPSHINDRRYRLLISIMNRFMARKRMIAFMGKRSMGLQQKQN